MTNGSRAADGTAVMARAIELVEAGESFTMATVVWRQAPSSGQHGSRAIVTAQGELFGWIGGACAEIGEQRSDRADHHRVEQHAEQQHARWRCRDAKVVDAKGPSVDAKIARRLLAEQ